MIIRLVVIPWASYFGLLEDDTFTGLRFWNEGPVSATTIAQTQAWIYLPAMHMGSFNLRFAYETVLLTRSQSLPWHPLTWLSRFPLAALPGAVITALQHVQNALPDFSLVQAAEHGFHIPGTSFIPLIDFLGNSVLISSSYFNASLVFLLLIFPSS